MSGERLFSWTIYDRPADFPDCYVARRFWLDMGPEPVASDTVMTSPDLEQLRHAMRGMGLACFARSPSDPQQIVETWL